MIQHSLDHTTRSSISLGLPYQSNPLLLLSTGIYSSSPRASAFSMPPKLASTPAGIIWTPPQLQQTYENDVVRKIYFVCYPPHDIDDPPTKYTNHWTISLQVTSSQSLLVSLNPAPITNKLRLEVTLKQYPVTTHCLFSVNLDPVQGLTVKDVLNLIRTNGLDRYTFDADGNGCRYWTLQFTTRLDQAGKVANSPEVVRLAERLGKTWTTGANRQVVEVKPPRGTPVSPGRFG